LAILVEYRDFAGLSALTPDYLKQLGLIEQAPGPETDIPYLRRMALDKVPFLAFAINDYFAPLSAWLDKQNKGNACRR
jgi:hypothetical protein